jgi:hypothetical protein
MQWRFSLNNDKTYCTESVFNYCSIGAIPPRTLLCFTIVLLKSYSVTSNKSEQVSRLIV